MEQTTTIQMNDVRELVRVTQEVIRTGADPMARASALLSSVARSIDAPRAMLLVADNVRPACKIRIRRWADFGFTDAQRRLHQAFLASDQTGDPLEEPIAAFERPLMVRRRSDLVEDRAWYRSEFVNEYHKPRDVDHGIIAVAELPRDGWAMIASWSRPWKGSNFDEAQVELVRLILAEMAPLLRALPTRARRDEHWGKLSPRSGETLSLLLKGATERAIARRLAISPHTVHTYVKAIYRHFDVHSRAELLSKFIGLPVEQIDEENNGNPH